MSLYRRFAVWNSTNEAVKSTLMFGTGEQKNFYYLKGFLIALSDDITGIDLPKLKATFREAGYNFDADLDNCLEDAQHPDSDALFHKFLTNFLPDQPGVIGFTLSWDGAVELKANKYHHYENSALLRKLLRFMLSRGILLVQPVGQFRQIEIRDYLQQLEPTKHGTVLPKYYYHGTSSKNFESILQRGLAPGLNKSNYNISHADKLFLTTDATTAHWYATNAAENVFHARNNDALYEEYEPIVFKIDSRLLDPAKMMMDYDLYVHFMRNKTVKGYDDFMDKAVEWGKSFAEMKTKLKDSFDPALLYKVGYKGRILPQSFVSVLYYRQELSIEQAKQKLRKR